MVRANYNDDHNNVYATTECLDRFFENLLLGHNIVQSANNTISKCKNCILEESALLRAIAENSFATQKELARMIKKSERTVKIRTVELQEKGYLRRENGKRNGRWEVLISLSNKDNGIN